MLRPRPTTREKNYAAHYDRSSPVWPCDRTCRPRMARAVVAPESLASESLASESLASERARHRGYISFQARGPNGPSGCYVANHATCTRMPLYAGVHTNQHAHATHLRTRMLNVVLTRWYNRHAGLPRHCLTRTLLSRPLQRPSTGVFCSTTKHLTPVRARQRTKVNGTEGGTVQNLPDMSQQGTRGKHRPFADGAESPPTCRYARVHNRP